MSIMATILPELANECEAKRDRLIKDISNVDHSSVIPDHYDKAKSILYLVDQAKKQPYPFIPTIPMASP